MRGNKGKMFVESLFSRKVLRILSIKEFKDIETPVGLSFWNKGI